MGSKKKRKREVEGGSPDIPVLRAMREELSLPYLPQLFYPDDADDTDPMRGNEKRTGASTSSEPDSWTSVEFREIDGVKRVVGLSLDNRTLTGGAHDEPQAAGRAGDVGPYRRTSSPACPTSLAKSLGQA
jgi:hypothetical protein